MNGKGFKQKYKRKSKKKPLIVTFDENARREFLTGFHKRNLQKKARAAEELQKQLKLERKRIKDQIKKVYQNLIRSQKPVPEVSHLLSEDIDMGEHCVSVTEISPIMAAQECSWIGQNQVCYENNDDLKNEKGSETNMDMVIDGMEVLSKQKKAEGNNFKLKTTNDFKKVIKRQAAQNMKQSKAFRTKSRVAQIKNMKRKRREERRKGRMIKKKKKGVKTKGTDT